MKLGNDENKESRFLREEKKYISPIILTTEKYSDNINCRTGLFSIFKI